MKRLWNVLVLVLAMNFLAVAGGAAWLVRAGNVDRDKILAIKELLFPKPQADDVTLATTQPATQPASRLEELLARQSGRTAAEHVEFIQRTFDAQAAQLDRRQRELNDLQRQVELAKEEIARDRKALEAERALLAQREEERVRLASDQGFQDSLTLYSSMPAKQVKMIFMDLDDATVLRYLQAMQPRTAAKIIKEFKTEAELSRIQLVLERMRQAEASAKD
jgi:flagellar motility protein MotE (MotC chaperone)